MLNLIAAAYVTICFIVAAALTMALCQKVDLRPFTGGFWHFAVTCNIFATQLGATGWAFRSISQWWFT
jgi:hypothetical protein